MNESFYMHQKFDEFKAFIDGLDTDARINPNSLNLAFDVWLKLKKEIYGLARLQKMKIEQLDSLKTDLDRLHRERDSFQQQARVLAEEVERLNNLFLVGFNQAVAERGHACMAIDGSNL